MEYNKYQYNTDWSCINMTQIKWGYINNKILTNKIKTAKINLKYDRNVITFEIKARTRMMLNYSLNKINIFYSSVLKIKRRLRW